MDNSQNATSSSKVLFDPGWNDPPTLSFNGQQSNRPRNFLNKRVAFPLSGGSPHAAPPVTNMPSMPTSGAPPCVVLSQNINKNTDIQQIDVDSESILKDVKSVLLEVLENCNELGPKVVDIKRRINVMEEMWSSKKLNSKIYLQMQDLAYALRDNQPNKADNIHRSLMIDQVSAVRTWMPGVKQLIHHCVAKTELLALEKESNG